MANTKLTIKKAEPTDLHTVHSIVIKTVSAIYPRYYPTGAVRFFLDHHNAEAIARDIAEEMVFVCYTPDNIAAGTITLRENEIKRLFVLPEFQGKGFGTTLLTFAERRLFKSFDKIILDSSLPAKGIYIKNGYIEADHQSIVTNNGDVLCWDRMVKYR